MRFWDANSIVPLAVNEERSEDMRRLLTEDVEQVVWWGTRTECVSALSRKAREGVVGPLGEARARVVLFYLAEAWNEVLLAALKDETLRSILEEALGLRPKDRRLLLGIARQISPSPGASPKATRAEGAGS